jgi:hypothetical protein
MAAGFAEMVALHHRAQGIGAGDGGAGEDEGAVEAKFKCGAGRRGGEGGSGVEGEAGGPAEVEPGAGGGIEGAEAEPAAGGGGGERMGNGGTGVGEPKIR